MAPAQTPPIEPAPIPAPTAADPALDRRALLQAFLEGAQLDPAHFQDANPEQVMRLAGEAYRQAILGVSEVLRDRAFVKNQFRIAQTMMSGRQASPLRIFEPAEAAVLMLKTSLPGFLGPGAALNQACQDMKKHQLGMLAGLRAALRAVLSALDPALLEPVQPRKRGLLGGGGDAAEELMATLKMRFEALKAEADDTPDSLLNREFRRGYEAFMEQLDRQALSPEAKSDGESSRG
jgi:type VI secretion system FHA domain protein